MDLKDYNKLLNLYSKIKNSFPSVSLVLNSFNRDTDKTDQEKLIWLLGAVVELDWAVQDLKHEILRQAGG